MHKNSEKHDGFDAAIARALNDEDRALLAQRHEPGYLAQAGSLFRGSLGWTATLVYLVSVVAFAGCLWAFWQAWAATHVLSAVKYGALAVLLFQCVGVMKSYLGTQLQTNRTLRELKRVELQVAMLREAAGRG